MLATEMYEKITRLSTDIYEGIFEAKNNYYNTRNAPVFSARNMKTVIYGLQTISYTAPNILDIILKEMKQVTTVNEFMVKIKIWKSEYCTC